MPIEFEIDKAHGFKTKEDIENFGIGKYNEECRSIVMKFSSEWRTIISRLGRWIDFDNGSHTVGPFLPIRLQDHG